MPLVADLERMAAGGAAPDDVADRAVITVQIATGGGETWRMEVNAEDRALEASFEWTIDAKGVLSASSAAFEASESPAVPWSEYEVTYVQSSDSHVVEARG